MFKIFVFIDFAILNQSLVISSEAYLSLSVFVKVDPNFLLQVILIYYNVILDPLLNLQLGSYLLRTIHATNRTHH